MQASNAAISRDLCSVRVCVKTVPEIKESTSIFLSSLHWSCTELNISFCRNLSLCKKKTLEKQDATPTIRRQCFALVIQPRRAEHRAHWSSAASYRVCRHARRSTLNSSCAILVFFFSDKASSTKDSRETVSQTGCGRVCHSCSHSNPRSTSPFCASPSAARFPHLCQQPAYFCFKPLYLQQTISEHCFQN